MSCERKRLFVQMALWYGRNIATTKTRPCAINVVYGFHCLSVSHVQLRTSTVNKDVRVLLLHIINVVRYWFFGSTLLHNVPHATTN